MQVAQSPALRSPSHSRLVDQALGIKADGAMGEDGGAKINLSIVGVAGELELKSEPSVGVGAASGAQFVSEVDAATPATPKVLTYRRLAVCTEYWARWVWLVGYASFLVAMISTKDVTI